MDGDAPKDYIAAIYWTHSKTFDNYELFTHSNK